jgi:hypothetical protein
LRGVSIWDLRIQFVHLQSHICLSVIALMIF